jgi:hypothetical protein
VTVGKFVFLNTVVEWARHQFYKSIYLLISNLVNSFIKKNFAQTYKPTIGADFHTKKLEIDDKMVTL